MNKIELTKTELKILKSLKVGMSYMEIVLDSSICMPSIKSHVHSIYSKLEAANKTSAIMKAQKLGFIE